MTHNLFAFRAISATPAVFRSNSVFYQPAMNKGGNNWTQQNVGVGRGTTHIFTMPFFMA